MFIFWSFFGLEIFSEVSDIGNFLLGLVLPLIVGPALQVCMVL